jgi:hypothetical protein
MNPRNVRISGAVAAILLSVSIGGNTYAADPPFTCTTNGGGNWAVSASAPTKVPCSTPTGECTQIQYTVTPLKGKLPEHVTVLVGSDVSVVASRCGAVAPPCAGDLFTLIGIRDCASQAVRLLRPSGTSTFDLLVEGDASVTTSSMAVKKGLTTVEACKIVSLDVPDYNPKAQLTTKETFQFKDCEVQIEINPFTGDPGTATVVSGDCVIDAPPIETLQLVINGTPQNVTIGDGWVSSGESSCTTRFVRSKPYVVCDCRDATDPPSVCP